MKATKDSILKIGFFALALTAGLTGRAQIYSDLLCAYPPSTVSAWGGEANTQLILANGVVGNNAINEQIGTGAAFNLVGFKMSARDSTNEDNATVTGMIAYDAGYADVRSYAASLGADQVVYVPCKSTGAAGNAGQPGTYSAIGSDWFWMVLLAHETGGHNYGRTHNDGMVNPKTVMMHNYCGGGAAYPYFYSDPNIWWNGSQMLSSLDNNCSNGSLPNGGDNSSYSAQWMANQVDHLAVGPALNNVVLRWCFTNSPGLAPAGTTNFDVITGAAAVVRGNGATNTGSALRLPGGTTGNVAMNSMSAYLDLPNGLLSARTNITIEIWAKPLVASNSASVLDFGRCTQAGDGFGASGEYTGTPGTAAPGITTGSDEVFLSFTVGTNYNQQRFIAGFNGSRTNLDSSLATTLGVTRHYAVTFSDGVGTYSTNGGRWQWYRDGYSVGFIDVSNHLAAFQNVNNWLGRSLWSTNANASIEYSEVRISSVALSQPQILANCTLGANYNLAGNLVIMTNSDSWNATTTSFNSASKWADGLTPSASKNYQTYNFRLLTPATSSAYIFRGNTLTIGSDPEGILEHGLFWGGTASSTITVTNLIVNNAAVHNRGSGTFTLAGNLTATNAVLVNAMNGPINLNAALNGNGSIVYVGNQAPSAYAPQNGLNTAYAGNSVTLGGNNANFTGQTVVGFGAGAAGGVTIDSEARLGPNPPTLVSNQLSLNRGTLTTTTTMTLSNGNRGILFDVNGGGFNVPTNTTLTLMSPLFSPVMPGGATGGNLNKAGAGTLVIASTNSAFNGMLYVGSGNSTNDGVVKLINNQAMANAHSPLYVRNVNNGTATLQLDGSSTNILLSQAISISGRNGSTPALQSLSGTNSIGGVILNSGGPNRIVQVDGGLLNIAGTSYTASSGAQTITFQGGGTVNFSSTLVDGNGTFGIMKAGLGTLNLSAYNNSYSGPTTVSGGILSLVPSSPSGPVLHLTFDNVAGSGNGSIITNTGSGGANFNGKIVGSGGASIVSGGRFGNALSLNGTGGTTSNNIVIITNKVLNTDSSASWTVGYWLKTTTAGAVIMYQGDGTWSSAGQTTYYLNSGGAATGTRAGYVRWGGGWLTGTTTLNDGAWHFVTLVDNAGSQTIYVDGNLDAVTSTVSSPLASNANQIRIGGSPDPGDGAAKMTGLIDEVYLFDRALSQNEVLALYGNNSFSNFIPSVLPATSPVAIGVGGVLDLAGVSQTIAGLSGGGIVTNSGTPVTLTVSNSANGVFGGSINDASAGNAVGLVKSGFGITTLAGANNYRGPTVVSGGTLQLVPTNFNYVVNDAVLHLTFNNAAGSGNNAIITNTGSGGPAFNGKIISTGGASIVTGGRFGNALNLNGTGGFTSNNIVVLTNKVMSTDASGTWTVGYWVKTTTAGAMIMYQGDGTWSSAGQTTFYLNNGSSVLGGTKPGCVRWGDGWFTGSTTLNNNAWHFVALVNNGGAKSIYVDGNLDTVTSTISSPLAATADQIWIGGSPNSFDGTAKMSGLIDEVYMFDRALNQSEIQTLFSTNNVANITYSNSGNVLPANTAVTINSGATLDLNGAAQTIASLTGSGVVTNSGVATILTLASSSGINTFGGIIVDAPSSGSLGLTQTGGATNIFTGVNTYRGTTTVNGGVMIVNGSLGTNTVTLNGGTLGGNGVVGGRITVSAGTLSPGTGIGVLVANKDVTLQSSGGLFMEINKTAQTNDQLLVNGAVIYGGTLVVTNLSGTLGLGDSFQLFSATSGTGSFVATDLPPLNSGLAWNFNVASGTLSVVSAVATNPTNIFAALSGGAITLSWPADHIGWRLQVQTNSLDTGLGASWFDVPGTAITNFLGIPVDPNSGSVFYRLIYP